MLESVLPLTIQISRKGHPLKFVLHSYLDLIKVMLFLFCVLMNSPKDHFLWQIPWYLNEVSVTSCLINFYYLEFTPRNFHWDADGVQDYPKIWLYGILGILSWRKLRNGRCWKDPLTFSPKAGHETLRWERPFLYTETRNSLVPKDERNPGGVWMERPC